MRIIAPALQITVKYDGNCIYKRVYACGGRLLVLEVGGSACLPWREACIPRLNFGERNYKQFIYFRGFAYYTVALVSSLSNTLLPCRLFPISNVQILLISGTERFILFLTLNMG